MRQKDSDEFIIETNRTCYDNLGKLYTDGQNDLDILIELGSWKELLGQLTGRNILNVGCGTADASVALIENGPMYDEIMGFAPVFCAWKA